MRDSPDLPGNELGLNPFESLYDPTMSQFNFMDPMGGYVKGSPGEQQQGIPFNEPFDQPTGNMAFADRLAGQGSGNVQIRQPPADPAFQDYLNRTGTPDPYFTPPGIMNPSPAIAGLHYYSSGPQTMSELEQLVGQLSTGYATRDPQLNRGFMASPDQGGLWVPGRLADDLGQREIMWGPQASQTNWDALIGREDADKLRQRGLDQPDGGP